MNSRSIDSGQGSPAPPTEALDRKTSGSFGWPAGPVLAGLRIYLGVIFLLAAKPKLEADPDFSSRLVGFLNNVALNQAHDFYRGFVTDLVLPNAGAFAALVTTGELLAGLMLVLGAASRLGAVIAIVMLLNYMFAKGMWFWTPSSNDAAFIMIALAVLLTRAGRTWGVDAALARRWPRVPLW